ncbi:hypothetical protein [Pyrodictium abyssi]|uniref:hypothetical protein n=1 Tax=Pyrodictium abyssi TaxID=54256 RepID=UPI0030C72809
MDYAGVVLVVVAVLLVEALVRVFAFGMWRGSRLVKALWLAGVLAVLFAPLLWAPRTVSVRLFAALTPVAVLGLAAASMVYSARAYGVGFEQLLACRYEKRRLAQHAVLWGLGGAAMIVGLFTVLAGGAGSDGRAVAVGLVLLVLGGAVFAYVLREAARLCRQAVEGRGS